LNKLIKARNFKIKQFNEKWTLRLEISQKWSFRQLISRIFDFLWFQHQDHVMTSGSKLYSKTCEISDWCYINCQRTLLQINFTRRKTSWANELNFHYQVGCESDHISREKWKENEQWVETNGYHWVIISNRESQHWYFAANHSMPFYRLYNRSIVYPLNFSTIFDCYAVEFRI